MYDRGHYPEAFGSKMRGNKGEIPKSTKGIRVKTLESLSFSDDRFGQSSAMTDILTPTRPKRERERYVRRGGEARRDRREPGPIWDWTSGSARRLGLSPRRAWNGQLHRKEHFDAYFISLLLGLEKNWTNYKNPSKILSKRCPDVFPTHLFCVMSSPHICFVWFSNYRHTQHSNTELTSGCVMMQLMNTNFL